MFILQSGQDDADCRPDSRKIPTSFRMNCFFQSFAVGAYEIKVIDPKMCGRVAVCAPKSGSGTPA